MHMNERKVKKTLVSINSTRTGRHSFLVAAEVDDKGTARISSAQRLALLKRAGICSNELFSIG